MTEIYSMITECVRNHKMDYNNVDYLLKWLVKEHLPDDEIPDEGNNEEKRLNREALFEYLQNNHKKPKPLKPCKRCE